MSGRSSRSTLMLTNSSFITCAVAGSSRLSCALGLCQRFRVPRPPVHRVMLVLEQIRAGLAGEAIFAGWGSGGSRHGRGAGHEASLSWSDTLGLNEGRLQQRRRRQMDAVIHLSAWGGRAIAYDTGPYFFLPLKGVVGGCKPPGGVKHRRSCWM